MAFDLTQTVPQRVQLWVDDVLKSSHLSEGEALSQASLIRRDQIRLGHPISKFEVRLVGTKTAVFADDVAPAPAPPPPAPEPPPPAPIPTISAAVGHKGKLGFVADDPAVVSIASNGEFEVIADGDATITPVVVR